MNSSPPNPRSGNCRRRGLFIAGLLMIAFLYTIPRAQELPAKEEPEHLEAVFSGIRANVVEGDLMYERGDARCSVAAGLELKEGDLVKSGPATRGELLLQPGNYLRIGPETEVRLLGDQYGSLRLQLEKGTISFELVRSDLDRSTSLPDSLGEGYDLVRVATQNAEVFLFQPGIFRVSVAANGQTEVVARRGEVLLNGQRVKEKQSAIAASSVVTIADVATTNEDLFESWCRERADKLIQANQSLKKEESWIKARKERSELTVDLPSRGGVNPYVVSARPGRVTFVESGVEVNQRAKDGWQKLSAEFELKSGDRVRTDSYSRAELMMLPDIYVRLDMGSELLLEQLSNDAISLKLTSGSAILDVARFERKELPPITIGGTFSSAAVDQAGNYRLDARSGGDEITVRKGKVIFKERFVGGCRRIAGGTASECNKKRNDNFDFWSQHRGEGDAFNGRALATYLARLRLQRFRNTGFWYQPPALGYYTFVPLHSTHFSSPYGGAYSSVLSPRFWPMYSEAGGRSSSQFFRTIGPPNYP